MLDLLARHNYTVDNLFALKLTPGFTGAMQDNSTNPSNLRYGTQEEYFSGLAWSIVGAHVPGLSGGYFGHWRYRPDNEPRGDT